MLLNLRLSSQGVKLNRSQEAALRLVLERPGGPVGIANCCLVVGGLVGWWLVVGICCQIFLLKQS